MPQAKNVFDDLSAKKKQQLAVFYETDVYKVLEELVELVRVNAAKHALDAPDINELKHLQGQAHGLKVLLSNMKELHKQSVKD